MGLYARRKNLAPSAPNRQPSTRALDSSRSLPFIAPLRARWSPVVFQRKTPSISFFFMPLRDSVPHNEGCTPLPHRSLGASATSGTSFNSLNFFALIFLRTLSCPERSRGVHVRHSARRILFLFTFFRTLLHDRFSQPLLFQLLPHSLAKTTGGTSPPMISDRNGNT